MVSSPLPETLTPSQIDADESAQRGKQIPGISPELQTVLQHVVDDVVASLSCVGAMVATLEADNTLPVRAYSVDIAPALLGQLESRLGVSFVGARSVAYLDDRRFKDNLAVRAIHGKNGRPEVVVSGNLHDLFRPVVNKRLSNLAQKLTGTKQVIAVPFFLEDEVVGNLFAAAREEFSQRDINFLRAFGHQAATAIQSQRRLTETQGLERVILALQAHITDETEVLQTIVDAVVQKLGYAGAMVATLEPDNSLPVRAYSVDIAPGLLRQLEDRLGVSMVGPRSVAYLDKEEFKDNLSVRAVIGTNGHPEIATSDKLHDLFRPVVNKPLSDLAQKLTGIKQVVAVPFFLEDEVVGNLFAATRKARFSEREKEILNTFGQQAAVGIRNARLYRETERLYQETDGLNHKIQEFVYHQEQLLQKSEARREMAQEFARMAFSAAASTHTLKNHMVVIRGHIHFLHKIDQLPDDTRRKVLGSFPTVVARLDAIADILANLHQPWRETPDILTDVNSCVTQALYEVVPRSEQIETTKHVETTERIEIVERIETTEGAIMVHTSLSKGLPPVKTSQDMLAEAYKVLVKNAVEAIQEKGGDGNLWVESRLQPNWFIDVLVRDSGIGIKSEDLEKIFEERWSTKEAGKGFGLFWTKDYVEGLGGSIRVESMLDEGTTICISLPSLTVQEGIS
jgi:signal transduction histidine kinase